MSEADDLGQGPVRQVEPSSPATHGFLFADLRGYTAYLDRRGAAAGAALLQRFRDLVRGAVLAHRGAEIRTEGDSFYVVFPSASTAVNCALAIVEAVAGERVANDDRIQVGVGVHAGEALETPEGPVGMAVNIAARLCAIAQPGEVMVSDTVRALTRGVGSAAFVRLGRRTIKGLDEPLTVYRAVPAGTATDHARPTDRRLGRLALMGAGLVSVGLVVALIAIPRLVAPAVVPTESPGDPSGAASGSAGSSGVVLTTSTVATCPSRDECTAPFAVPFAISLGSDWALRAEGADAVAFEHRGRTAGWIEVMLLEAALDPPCETTKPTFLGDNPEDVIDWLSQRPWLNPSDPRPYNVGTHLGRAIDIEMPAQDRWTCEGPHEAGSAYIFRLGSPTDPDPNCCTYFAGESGERYRMIAIEVQGRTVTLAIGRTAHPEAFWRMYGPFLQTIEFGQPDS